MSKIKNSGFTLSEVLITLGIIGIVAAMTIPTLVQNHNKKVLALKLKTTYTILNNALKMSIAENGDFENWGLELEPDSFEYVEKYWKPYLKIIKTCRTSKECNYKVQDPWYCRNSKKQAMCASYWYKGMTTAYVLANGTQVVFAVRDGYNQFVSEKRIYVDINGPDNPNEYGKDFFSFRVTDNGVVPTGYSKSLNELNTNCSKDNYKWYCAAKIMHDGWQIKDDYPW